MVANTCFTVNGKTILINETQHYFAYKSFKKTFSALVPDEQRNTSNGM